MSFLLANQPKTVRMPVNPLDKATIVSVYPKEIVEFKLTIIPSKFVIPAAPPNKFSLSLIETASWWRLIDEHQPLLEIPNSSVQVAESLIKDYCSGLVGCNMGDRMPGLFYIPGEYDEHTIIKYPHFLQLLNDARAKQKNWFLELVRQSDTDWSRTNGNPLSISDDARMAARILGFEKPWLADFQAIQMVNCFACGSMVNPLYPICANCKTVVNREKALELGLIKEQK